MSDEITDELRLLNEAIALAAEVHVGQVRKQPDGRPYICHVLDVVNALPEHMHEFRLVAALHDTIEDIEPARRQWLKDTIRAKFGAEVLAGVEAMSHEKPEDLKEAEELDHYLEYVRKQVLANPHAPAVKLADNYVNMKDRIAQFAKGGADAEKARKKLHQYAQSIAALTEPKQNAK
jgi:(p)ppGpp synthase/HD superfamily hydrolase